jgi:hypothetical protein
MLKMLLVYLPAEAKSQVVRKERSVNHSAVPVGRRNKTGITGAFGGLLGQRVAALRMQAPRGHAGWAHARRPFTLP